MDIERNQSSMEDRDQKGVLIPKTTMWAILITLIGVLISSWVTFQVNFVRLEKEIAILQAETYKEIELLKRKIEKEHSVNLINAERFEKIQKQLYEIEKAVTLKQDKKFIE